MLIVSQAAPALQLEFWRLAQPPRMQLLSTITSGLSRCVCQLSAISSLARCTFVLSSISGGLSRCTYPLSLSTYPDESVKNLLLPTYPATCLHQVISGLAGSLAMQLSSSNYYHIIASWRQFAFYCREDET